MIFGSISAGCAVPLTVRRQTMMRRRCCSARCVSACWSGWRTSSCSPRAFSMRVAAPVGARASWRKNISLDIASGMLLAARSRSGWWRKLFGGAQPMQVCADIEALPLATNSVEMVWSNLAVQWCNDLPAAFAGLHRALKADGLLMFSTFGPDTLKELRQAFSGVDSHNHLNRFADMHDIGDMLVHAGFAEPVMDMEYLTLTYDDVRGVLHDLKRIGAHNATAGRGHGLMGKNAWARLVESYERLRRDGKLPATYEVVYGHAWKPQPRTTGDGAAIVQTTFKLK